MIYALLFIIILFIGYFWYQSTSTAQFMRGVAMLSKQRTIEAVSIFEDLFERHPDAPVKLAECKMIQGLEYLSYDKVIAKSFFEQVIEIKKQAPAKARKKSFEKLEKRAYLEIAKIDFNLVINEPPAQKKLYRIHENLQFINNAPKKGYEKEFNNISRKYTQELAGSYYFLGKNYEKELHLVEAIQFYSKIINLANVPLALKTDATVRLGICKLKLEEDFNETLLDKIENASEDIKRDFYFRYTLKLIREKKFADAESTIQNQLDIDSPVIEKLKRIIYSTRIDTIKSKIDKINQTIDSLYENTFTMEDLKSFYDNLDTEINVIKTVIPSITEKLNQIKPSLFNRLLTNYIEEKKFANAINIIQKYPFFWENPELLKNLGICCYGYTSQGNLEENNYKIIISYFLTAVYSDKAMIKSLEQISRKDNYTYTLIESIGSTCLYQGKLPPNINYDEVSETNISIGATQKELLVLFESLLSRKINNPNLINIAHSFFSFEKEATGRLIKVINRDILCASPYFAKIFGINKTITTSLTEIYENDKNEDALEAGIPYITGDSNTYIKSYAIAKDLVYKAVKAIQNEDLAELKLLNSRGKSNPVTQYTQIAAKAEELLFKSIASKINSNSENDRLIPLMEEIICFSSKNEKLRKQYSAYIASYCINKMKVNAIDHLKALSLMKSAYMYSPDNVQICQNFIAIIKFNLIDILNNKSLNASEIYKLLDDTYMNRSATFNQESADLKKNRDDILRELSQKGADLSLFEDSQDSYPERKSMLTPQIERTKEVLSYLKKMSEV
jgi:hypothetical protein